MIRHFCHHPACAALPAGQRGFASKAALHRHTASPTAHLTPQGPHGAPVAAFLGQNGQVRRPRTGDETA